MTPRHRTLLAIGLFIPMAAILFATFACLPAPVGDPEQSKVDDKLTGAWQAVPTEADAKDAAANKQVAVALLRPWDGKTYFLQYLFSETKDGKDDLGILNYKAWLTPLAGATFITCEPLDNKDFLAAGVDPDRYYWVAKLERKDDTVTLTPIDENSAFMKDLKTRETIEAAIKAHVNDKSLYTTPMTFKKLPKDKLEIVQSFRQKAKLGIDVSSDGATITTAPATAPKGMP